MSLPEPPLLRPQGRELLPSSLLSLHWEAGAQEQPGSHQKAVFIQDLGSARWLPWDYKGGRSGGGKGEPPRHPTGKGLHGRGVMLPLFTWVASACFTQPHLLMNGETEAEQLGAHPGLNAGRGVRPDASNPLMVAETGRMPQC